MKFQTVPVIDDDGFCLAESQAIVGYLVGQYGKDDRLFPQEPRQKALVDRILMFDAAVFFPNFGGLYVRFYYLRYTKLIDEIFLRTMHSRLL